MTRVQDVYPSDRASLREVGLRDGLQLVKKFPSTTAKQRWMRDEYGAGVRHFEVGSFLPARTFPQFADVCDIVRTVAALPIEWNGANIGEGLKVPVLGADTAAVRAELEAEKFPATGKTAARLA